LAHLWRVRCVRRFEEESVRRLDRNQRCLFLSNAAMQWLDIRLQMVGVAVVTSISAIAVVQHHYGDVDPGEQRPGRRGYESRVVAGACYPVLG